MKNTTNKSKWIIALMVISLVTVYSCSKEEDPVNPGGPDPEEYDRIPMLTNFVDGYIIPAYAEYVTQTGLLKSEVTAFNTAPTVNGLQTLRIKWESVLLVWQDVAFLEFGPAENISLRAQTNVYPVDTALIHSNIASGSYNLQLSSNFDAKGLQALDYLLNGIGATDNDIASYFASNANARAYLVDVVHELDNYANQVSNEWVNTYRSSFIANSASNAVGTSVNNVLNAISLHYETYIRKGKIGLPAGVFNGFSQLPMPKHVEAYYYGQSLPFVYRSLASIKKFINGKSYASAVNGEGLDDYLAFVNAESGGQDLEVLINNQFAAVQAELANINDPLSNEVITNNQAVRNVYQDMQVLVPYIKVNMTNALGGTITYQDNDGD